MASLYVLGARQRKLLFKHEEEQNLYEAALILRIDTETAESRTCVEYKSPLEACSGPNASMVFKSATIVGDTLYCCTSTEVIIFELPTFQKIGYISIPHFNDVHHVTPVSDGNLVVVSTGLDMVFKVSREGKVLNEWTVLDKPIGRDFRKMLIIEKSKRPNRTNHIRILRSSWMAKSGSPDSANVTQSACRTRAGESTLLYKLHTTG